MPRSDTGHRNGEYGLEYGINYMLPHGGSVIGTTHSSFNKLIQVRGFGRLTPPAIECRKLSRYSPDISTDHGAQILLEDLWWGRNYHIQLVDHYMKSFEPTLLESRTLHGNHHHLQNTVKKC